VGVARSIYSNGVVVAVSRGLPSDVPHASMCASGCRSQGGWGLPLCSCLHTLEDATPHVRAWAFVSPCNSSPSGLTPGRADTARACVGLCVSMYQLIRRTYARIGEGQKESSVRHAGRPRGAGGDPQIWQSLCITGRVRVDDVRGLRPVRPLCCCWEKHMRCDAERNCRGAVNYNWWR